MAGLSAYARVLRRPGAALFSATGVLARFPISTVSLGIVLLVEGTTGSYALAGGVSSAYVLASAALAVVHGRLADRLGQARAVVPAVVLFAVATGVLVAAVVTGLPQAVTLVAAAVAGGALPQVGSCVRARWSHVLRDTPADLPTAFALEGVLDEVVFMTGPVLVTVLATTWDPAAGLLTAAAAGLVGTLAFAAQRGTEPPAHPRARGRADDGSSDPGAEHGRRTPLPWSVVAPLVVLSGALGAVFGSTEVVTVAFTEHLDSPGWSGPMLALWALGSLLGGVVTGAVTWRSGPLVRVRAGVTALTLLMAPLLLVGSLPVLGLVLLLSGFAIAPTLISVYSLIEQAVPAPRLTESLAVLHTGTAVGIAPGAALSGWVVDHHGAGAAYAVPVVAAALGVLCAVLAPARSTTTAG